MARVSGRILDSGERFPELKLQTVAHGTVTVPEAFGAGWGVFLVYRAHW